MTHQVVRGGSFNNYARYVRCAVRIRLDPGDGDVTYGFRVVEEQ